MSSGVKEIRVNLTPSILFEFNLSINSFGSIKGAPIVKNGESVPLPSEMFVPSRKQVPG